jgi:hypothetical protein
MLLERQRGKLKTITAALQEGSMESMLGVPEDALDGAEATTAAEDADDSDRG